MATANSVAHNLCAVARLVHAHVHVHVHVPGGLPQGPMGHMHMGPFYMGPRGDLTSETFEQFEPKRTHS